MKFNYKLMIIMNKHEKEHLINDLLNRQEEELLLLLGEDIEKFRMGAIKNEEKNLKAGKNWFNKNREEIIQYLCNSKIIQSFNSKTISNKVDIVAAIADVIVAKWVKLPVFVISTLIFKEGIDTICNDDK